MADRKKLMDMMPEGDDDMGPTTLRILMGLHLIASRLDDVYEPSIVRLEENIGEMLSKQDELLSNVKSDRDRLDQVGETMDEHLQDSNNIISRIDTLAGEPHLCWASRLQSWAQEKPKAAILSAVGMLALMPWVSMISALILHSLLERFFGIDLHQVAPWLFETQ